MKAVNIEITPKSIGFNIQKDDGTSYTNANGRPVRVSIGGWINHLPTEYTQADVATWIDDQMYQTIQVIEKTRGRIQTHNAKVDKFSTIEIPKEIIMTEKPEIVLKSEKVPITGSISGATTAQWAIDDKVTILKNGDFTIDPKIDDETATLNDGDGDSAIDPKIDDETTTLNDGDGDSAIDPKTETYTITITATNKRGSVTKKITVTKEITNA